MEDNQFYFDNISNGAYPKPERPRDEKGSGRGLFLGGMIAGLAGALFVTAIVYISFYIQGRLDADKGTARQVSMEAGAAIDSNVVKKLQSLERVIDKYYYLGDVSEEKLQDGIYKGMIQALGDPYSEYYSAEELTALMEHTEGVYYGIGAYITVDADTGLPKISGTIAGAPAEKADLRANDLIYEVDGVSVNGLSVTETVAMIKGPENTDVKLTIARKNERDYLHVTVTRAKVETRTVEYKALEEGIAYIQVTEFDDVSVKQFEEALKEAKASKAKGIILDLRANPGGSLYAVVEMCRMILPKGMIVYTEDKNGKRVEYTCDGSHRLKTPLVVLIDMNSASASEIMAGAIKDHGIGTLVGTTSFGKGIVQQIIPFEEDGSAVKITISAYYTPSGNNIHGIGIEPDVVCEFDGEAYYGNPERPDNQLEKAKEVLKGLTQGQ